jgi:hypothetical protein
MEVMTVMQGKSQNSSNIAGSPNRASAHHEAFVRSSIDPSILAFITAITVITHITFIESYENSIRRR